MLGSNRKRKLKRIYMKNLILAFILILISSNVFAIVKKVEVVNASAGLQWSLVFGSFDRPIEEMQPWIDKHKALKTFGNSESDYIITITDLTAQYEQAQIDADARKTDIAQIRAAIALIDQSSKPAWEKKLLKRLVLELKE